MRINEVLDTARLIKVNKRLNPKIWDGGDLKSDVRAKLEEIALAFEEFIGIELDVVDRTITGSNANYTWNEYSDLDLHLIIPGVPTDEQKELFNAKKALWGEQHDIRIKGLPVECYVQGQDEPHHSTGVYSIADNQWLVEPKKTKPEVDDAAVTAKKDSLVHDVQAAMLSNDLETIRKVKDKITKMRKAGLERAGEWSTENLVFKLLRNQGIIDRITERIRELEDQELSLEQQDNVLD
jgi:hypothetical protein